MPSGQFDTPAWADFTDAALGLLVALHQFGRGQQVEVFEGRQPTSADEITALLTPGLTAHRERFTQSLRSQGSELGAIAANARLSDAESELLAVALACELDARRQRVLAYLQDDPALTRVTLQTAGWLLGGIERVPAAIGPDAHLRRAALVEVVGSGPWAQQQIVVPESVVWAFLGDAALEPNLPADARLVESTESGDADLVFVVGPDRVRRREVALARCSAVGFLVSSEPVDERGWSALVREGTLTGRGVVIELHGQLSDIGRRWIERADHLPWAITSSVELPIGDLPDRDFVEVEAENTAVSDDEWSAAFGSATPRRHRLSAQQVEQVRKVRRADETDIDRAVRRLLAGPLESQARRIRPRHRWDDLVLNAAGVEQLREIVDRYRLAGQVYDRWSFSAVPSRGLVALFSGPSGTGKTLAAEIVAAELGLDLFKLDVASVVSKYIGETEKNLDKLFDAAGMGNVVLFFDEADALFGKRSEVKDAHDRYANLEVSYLLQRIESFDGVVVLATNYERSIDDAFRRRIHARIEFTPPEHAERLAIWTRHFPADAPLEAVDLDWVAKQFTLTGGQIRNAAVHAGFVAAAAGTNITMEAVVRGVAREQRKAGRLLKPADYGEWYPLVAGSADQVS